MRVVLVVNASAGKGRAGAVADRFERALRGAGHGVRRVEVGAADLSGTLEGAGALVVAGGDGTVHSVLGDAVRCGVPVYQAPAGTENLFARAFGMDGDPRGLIRAMGGGSVRRVDVGSAGGRLFALMVSVGLDAGVIRRLSARRRGPIRHASYVGPIVAELASPSLPRLTVEVDGRVVVGGRRGLAVVANARPYAMGLDPARDANPEDGVLDVVWVPMGTRREALVRLAGAVLRGPGRCWVGARGRRVRIGSAEAAPVQMDGEAAGEIGAGEGLEVEVKAGRLGVLC